MTTPETLPFGKRFHAWFLNRIEPTMDRMYGDDKQRMFAEVSGTVVEIGAGTGANMRYYRPGQRVIAVEPNPAMHDRLRAAAAEAGVEVDIRGVHGEQMDVEDETADHVVSTLVLCSVNDPRQVLAEVRRILKPGGRFHFIEHVAAPKAGIVSVAQRAMHRPHAIVFDGCQTDRDTGRSIDEAGFANVRYERRTFWSPLFWVAPHIVGVAVR